MSSVLSCLLGRQEGVQVLPYFVYTINVSLNQKSFLGMSCFTVIVPDEEFYSEFNVAKFNGTFLSIGFGKCSYLNKAFSFASWGDEAICICAILYVLL